uniref:MACPF domain-containing protein n=1 Tax=Panagrolaimus davidi TaxID=227884 RepID=A0A914Q7E8_9BILA
MGYSKLFKTSSIFNSFDEYKSLASNKLTISGSASAKEKGSASASFARETSDTKESFVKIESFMLQNKIIHLAYDFIGNEHGGLDESFVDRVKEIAADVHKNNNLKAQFLAENLVANYGTHVIHKATAAAEIVQNIFIKKSEEYKGEKHITEIKTGLLFVETRKRSSRVAYECPNFVAEVTVAFDVECHEEFIHACSTHSDEINSIESKNKDNMEYKKGIFHYVSGCGDVENGGYECINNKAKQFYIKTKKMKSYCLEAEKERHDPSAPANDVVAPPADKKTEAEGQPANDAPAVKTTTSNSNNQNVTSNLLEFLELDG